MTQTQLAQLLGKSLRTVQSYESGESRILLDTVTTIAHALGVTPAYLLGVSEPQIKLNTLADVVTVLYELNKKQELHFDIDITHERCDDGNFTASLKFRATDPDATLNETLCFLLEQFSFTQEMLAKRMGISQSALANKLRLLKLPSSVRQVITKEGLTERQARVLLRLKDEKLQQKALQTILAQGLNVRQTDELVKSMLEPPKPKKKKPSITGIVRDARIYINTIRKATKQMESSGLNIQVEEEQAEDCVMLHIRVPKKKA